jgi:undecaprenyl-diphosphatase
VLILYFLLRRKKWDAFRVLMVALSSLGMMSLLKNLFQRHRPLNPLIEGITNYSFPSGHAFMSVVFFGLLIYFAVYNERYRWVQYIFVTLVLILLFLIGFSRVYLRVHYTTDVLAGWICGTLWLVLCFELLNRIKKKKPVEKI